MMQLESALVIGVILGGLYGILAVGFVLVYRATRVLNLAHGEIGTSSTLFFVYVVVEHHWSYWLALAGALLVGAAVALLIESTVIDKLRNAPALVCMVVTLGIAQVLVATNGLIISPAEQAKLSLTSAFPQPFQAHLTVGHVTLSGGTLCALFVIPIVVLGLTGFLRYARFGIAMRASADNPDNARLLGISPRLVSVTAWAMSGALAALAGILISSTRGAGASLTFGMPLLLRALAPAVVGGLTSMPVAAASGLGVGVIESLVLSYTHSQNYADLALFLIVLAALLLRRRGSARSRDADNMAFSTTARLQVPAVLRGSPALGRLRRGTGAAAAVFAVLLAYVVPSHDAFILSIGAATALAALSVGLIAGLLGQVSLGQWAVAGVGAFAAAVAAERWSWNVLVALLFAMAAGAVASLVVGLPALRLHGLFLSVTTLAFAVAAAGWLFTTSFATSLHDTPMKRPRLFGVSFLPDNTMYLLALGCLAFGLLVAHLTRTSRTGRNMVAIRENERAAAAMGVNVVATKLTGFCLSGAIAGLAGGLLAYTQQGVSYTNFPAESSFLVVAVAVVGGMGTLLGPVLGALALVVLPALFPDQNALALLASGAGVVLIVHRLPGGLVSVFTQLRDLLLLPDEAEQEPGAVIAAPPTQTARAPVESLVATQ